MINIFIFKTLKLRIIIIIIIITIIIIIILPTDRPEISISTARATKLSSPYLGRGKKLVVYFHLCKSYLVFHIKEDQINTEICQTLKNCTLIEKFHPQMTTIMDFSQN